MNRHPHTHTVRAPDYGMPASAALTVAWTQPGWDPRSANGPLLARVTFAEQGACDNLQRLVLPLPPMGGGSALDEVWLTDRPIREWGCDGVLLRGNEDLIFGAIGLADDDLESATFQAYERIFDALAEGGGVHLIRTWNFFSRIHEEREGVDRYGLFCRGRHRALSRRSLDRESNLPAASAIGTAVPGLAIYFLADRRPGLQIENPRQVSAFHYPRIYAPKSPSFSRSVLHAAAGGGYRLYVSGTAAIVGHVSQHPGELMRQLHETCDNLEALLGAASHRAGVRLDFRMLRVYLRQTMDPADLQPILARRFGHGVRLFFLRGDICRRDLLVEIEGIAEGPPPAHPSVRAG